MTFVTREVRAGTPEFQRAIDRAETSGRADIAWLLRTGSRFHELTSTGRTTGAPARAERGISPASTDDELLAWMADRRKSNLQPAQPQPAPEQPPPLAAQSLLQPVELRSPSAVDASQALLDEVERRIARANSQTPEQRTREEVDMAHRNCGIDPTPTQRHNKTASEELAEMALKSADEVVRAATERGEL